MPFANSFAIVLVYYKGGWKEALVNSARQSIVGRRLDPVFLAGLANSLQQGKPLKGQAGQFGHTTVDASKTRSIMTRLTS
jgi:hypothetical protein